MIKGIKLAPLEASKSTMKWRVGAVLLHRSRVIGRGYNHHLPPKTTSVHAEMAAILEGLSKIDRLQKFKRILKGCPQKWVGGRKEDCFDLVYL